MKINSTIVALATAKLNCAIHLIRLSGPKAYEYINKILKNKISKDSFKIKYNYIIDNKNQLIDEVLLNLFTAPKSYTGEDMIEINCHGGVVVAQTIINLLLDAGAVMANRGEFSQRAMLNKKIDISQVEAIANLVYANNIYGIKGATKALSGSLTNQLSDISRRLLLLLGQAEVNIDYPEYEDVIVLENKDLKTHLEQIYDEINKLIYYSNRFLPVANGIKIVIIGNVNAGKSSLLNALTNQEKAIVSDIEGTTRDVVESQINIDDITLRIFDTAGIRKTSNKIEQIGINKAKELINEADLILYLYSKNDNNYLSDSLYIDIKDKNHIVVLSKSDLYNIKPQIIDKNSVYISAINKEIDPLIDLIKQKFNIIELENLESNVCQSERQINLLKQINNIIKLGIDDVNNNMPIDLIINYLQDANYLLNQILGKGSNYDFLDDLFNNFCVGK